MKTTFLFAMKAVELSLPNTKVKMKEWLPSISRLFLNLLWSLIFFFFITQIIWQTNVLRTSLTKETVTYVRFQLPERYTVSYRGVPTP